MAMDPIAVAKILLYCSMYMVIGPALILVNKYILKDLEFKYPMVRDLLLLKTSL